MPAERIDVHIDIRISATSRHGLIRIAPTDASVLSP